MEIEETHLNRGHSITKPFHTISRRISNTFNESSSQLYSKVFHHLIFLFQIAYYTCVIPFRIQKSRSGFYKIYSSKLQKVLTVLLNLITGFYIIRSEYVGLEYGRNYIQHPQNFVKMLSGISKIPFYFTCVYIFWTKRATIENLLKFSQNSPNFEKRNIRTIVINVIVVLLLIHSVGTTFYIWCKLYDTWEAWLNYGSRFATKLFNLKYSENITTCVCDNVTNSSTTETELFPMELRALGVLVWSSHMYTYYAEDLFALSILVSTLMVYHSCNGFFNALQSNTRDILKVSEHYLKVREIVNEINEFFGPLIFVYVLDLLFTCLHTPFELAESDRDHDHNLLMYSYIVKFFVLIFIAAEANRKMKHLKEWLFQYRIHELMEPENDTNSKIQATQLYQILKDDCETNKIGLGCNLFTITYGFIGLLFSVLATYGAIQLQFYNAAKSNNTSV